MFRLTQHAIRKVAVEACCDPQTVRRYVAGHPMKSTAHERVRAALERLNLRVEYGAGATEDPSEAA